MFFTAIFLELKSKQFRRMFQIGWLENAAKGQIEREVPISLVSANSSAQSAGKLTKSGMCMLL